MGIITFLKSKKYGQIPTDLFGQKRPLSIHLKKARYFKYVDKYEQAAHELRQGLKNEPDSKDAYIAYDLLYTVLPRLGNRKEAIQAAKMADMLNPFTQEFRKTRTPPRQRPSPFNCLIDLLDDEELKETFYQRIIADPNKYEIREEGGIPVLHVKGSFKDAMDMHNEIWETIKQSRDIESIRRDVESYGSTPHQKEELWINKAVRFYDRDLFPFPSIQCLIEARKAVTCPTPEKWEEVYRYFKPISEVLALLLTDNDWKVEVEAGSYLCAIGDVDTLIYVLQNVDEKTREKVLLSFVRGMWALFATEGLPAPMMTLHLLRLICAVTQSIAVPKIRQLHTLITLLDEDIQDFPKMGYLSTRLGEASIFSKFSEADYKQLFFEALDLMDIVKKYYKK